MWLWLWLRRCWGDGLLVRPPSLPAHGERVQCSKLPPGFSVAPLVGVVGYQFYNRGLLVSSVVLVVLAKGQPVQKGVCQLTSVIVPPFVALVIV